MTDESSNPSPESRPSEVSAEVSTKVSAEVSTGVPGDVPPEAQPGVAASLGAAPASVALPGDAEAGYRRLMTVGLDVKLRFGTRRMLLRDVLALSAGAVIELDNALNSPVDLLLDGRLIARGEVVVVDGKYGLRVTDVPEAASAGTAAD